MWTGLSKTQWTWEATGVVTDWLGLPSFVRATIYVCTEATASLCPIDSSGFFGVFSIQDHDCPGHSFILSPGVNINDGVHMRSELVCLVPTHSLAKYQRLLEHSDTAVEESAQPLSQ